jgi:hypothetical protein
MSYINFTHLQYADLESIDLAADDAAMLALLDEMKLHHDVAIDLANLFAVQEASFNLYGGWYALQPLLAAVSARWPQIAFGVQGRGEELRDVWVAEFLGGEVTYLQGPFIE